MIFQLFLGPSGDEVMELRTSTMFLIQELASKEM